jgi:hypothetical protein
VLLLALYNPRLLLFKHMQPAQLPFKVNQIHAHHLTHRRHFQLLAWEFNNNFSLLGFLYQPTNPYFNNHYPKPQPVFITYSYNNKFITTILCKTHHFALNFVTLPSNYLSIAYTTSSFHNLPIRFHTTHVSKLSHKSALCNNFQSYSLLTSMQSIHYQAFLHRLFN